MRSDFDREKSLQAFLETALASVQPIGGVEVHPNYGVTPDESEKSKFVKQFERCLEQGRHSGSFESPQGFEVTVSADWPLVKKYIENIVAGTGAGVQVLPPGGPIRHPSW